MFLTAQLAAPVPPPLDPWHSMVLLVPVLVALGAVVISRRTAEVTSAWRWARVAATIMMAAAVAAVVRTVIGAGSNAALRTDTVGVAMLLLVTFVAWVVIRYSQHYLGGDARQRRAIVGLLSTVGFATVVIVTNNLVVLTLAWLATSLALHRLLTFFGDRPAAISAAHKKFILSRCADVSMLGATAAFALSFGTVRIDRIVTAAAATGLPGGARMGIALVALAAVLKCAQLPFHGWLLQVMEAPTPVSALLHAGVVNLGGFVLLRFAPLVDAAIETRALLVLVGTATAVIAALVMTTRVSIKVSLAWSTCAQMGFSHAQNGAGDGRVRPRSGTAARPDLDRARHSSDRPALRCPLRSLAGFVPSAVRHRALHSMAPAAGALPRRPMAPRQFLGAPPTRRPAR